MHVLITESEPGNWLAYGRDYEEQRFSPLTQINRETVDRLGLAFSLFRPRKQRCVGIDTHSRRQHHVLSPQPFPSFTPWMPKLVLRSGVTTRWCLRLHLRRSAVARSIEALRSIRARFTSAHWMMPGSHRCWHRKEGLGSQHHHRYRAELQHHRCSSSRQGQNLYR